MAMISLQHPGWVALGIAMILVGVWLIRWANRNNMASVLSSAATEAAIGAMRKGTHHGEVPSAIKAGYDDVASAPTHAGKAKKVTGYIFRNAMSQLFGVIGFIMVVVGLMLAVLGLFYPSA
jgi:uncharacterized membrane protein